MTLKMTKEQAEAILHHYWGPGINNSPSDVEGLRVALDYWFPGWQDFTPSHLAYYVKRLQNLAVKTMHRELHLLYIDHWWEDCKDSKCPLR